MLTASYLYLLCQAFDIRALQADFNRALASIVQEELTTHFGERLPTSFSLNMIKSMLRTLDSTTTMDAAPRMTHVAGASVPILVDFFTTGPSFDPSALSATPAFRASVASRATARLVELRKDYLSGARGPAPASDYLGRTRPIYEFIRLTLGIRMHGSENESVFANGLGVEDVTIGQNVALIHEVRDTILVEMRESSQFYLGNARRQNASYCREPLCMSTIPRLIVFNIDYFFPIFSHFLALLVHSTLHHFMPYQSQSPAI